METIEMINAEKERYLCQLCKVLDELAVQFPFFVTPAYIERRIAEEQMKG